MSNVSRCLANPIKLNRYVPDAFPRKVIFRSAMLAAARSARRWTQTCSKSRPQIAIVELVDGLESLLPKGRSYADLEKPAPWVLPKDLDQACMNKLPVRPVVARRRMATIKWDVVTVTIHQSTRSWSEGYSSHAVRTAKRPTFPVTIRDGQCQAVSGEHRKPRMAKLR